MPNPPRATRRVRQVQFRLTSRSGGPSGARPRQQFRNAFTPPRQDEVRTNVRQRLQHESSLRQPRVRQHEIRILHDRLPAHRISRSIVRGA